MNRYEPAGIGKETGRALRRHADEARQVVDSGDAGRIRQLYADLAEQLLIAVEQDGVVPVLSYHEIAAVVAARLAGTTGVHLDVGCGPNPLASTLLAVGTARTVIGTDIGLGMVTLARRSAAEAGITLHGVVSDAERLPFRDAVFGSVVCDDTIEHLPDDDAGVRELARVTCGDGRIALATPNRNRLPVLARRFRDRIGGRRTHPRTYFAAESHLREYTWTDIVRLVRPHLDVVERGHVPWAGSTLKSVVSRLTALPGGRSVGRVILVILTPKQG